MEPSVNVHDLIQKSTSDVSVTDLAKKGFQRVKVLNRSTINKLIEDAVGRAVANRSELISASERQRILEDSRAEFQGMMKQHRSDEERRGSEFQQRIQELSLTNEQLRRELEERNVAIAELENRLASQAAVAQPPPAGADLDEIKGAIQSLAAQISHGLARGGGATSALSSAGPALEALLERIGDAELESNVGQVEVKKASAGGVSKNLEKLRSLNKGSRAPGE